MGVTTGNTLDIVRAVEENRLDLGLVTLPVQGRSLAVTAMLDEEFVTIYASRETEMPAVYTPAELQAQPLIAFEAGSGTRDLIDRWFRSAGLAVTPVMQLGSIEAIKRMVRAGLGYSIVPRMAVERVEDRDGLRVHSLAPRLYRQLAVVMRQDKIVTKGIAEMLRLLHTVRL
ncbi:LysR substrate binding domain protein [Klebsiella pneumoniae]|nr:LysR substrate binding domain protein [Klebsiella pneumoniae]